jgi:hypothetical protein
MTRRQGNYSDAVRERAVRLVVDQRGKYESEWPAIPSVASKSGCRRRRCGCGWSRRSVMRAAGLA